ncbi:hypothetical protein TrRE_jg10957 [Triparma retinervis]|uniref:PDEase domain-containing protein n=1 Tax=Triparma retinervis TaxID=2557542 RepID=A0A9W7KVG5_9STRA|nr:hypothetical protein TrRE_jg10957 [Triparma retinervis]
MSDSRILPFSALIPTVLCCVVASTISAAVVARYSQDRSSDPPSKTPPGTKTTGTAGMQDPQSSSPGAVTSLVLPLKVPDDVGDNAIEIFKQVKEYRRKIEVLLYMQEAVVNVMDFTRVLGIIVDCAYSIVPADRISVMVLSDDRKSMTVFVSKDVKSLCISSTKGVAGYVATTGLKLNIKDAYEDPRFDSTVDDEVGFKTKSLVCVPILAGGGVVGVIQACNKKGGFDEEDERGLEALSLSAGSAIRKAQLYASAIRKSNAILNVVRCRTSGASIPDLINVVTRSTYNLLLAERVSVYLVDRIKGEIWICVSKDPSISGLTLPIGRGISGQVAKDGKTINVKDCYTDDRFDNSCDKKTGFVTRSMLCMAVPGFDDESKPVAVIQAINKLGAKSFDDEDEEALSAFCNEVKMAMRGNFLEAALLKLESDQKRQTHIDGTSYLREFGAMFGRTVVSEDLIEPNSPTSWGGKKQTKVNRRLSVPWNAHSTVGEDQEFDDYGFDLFSKSRDDLCAVVFSFFEDLNLCDRLNVDDDILQNLILAIFETYNDVPFHNYYHAFSVCHMTYMMIRHCDCARYLTSLDIFSALIAALSHDADHPGVSNSYLVAMQKPLAVVHNDDAVLERHHASTTTRILAEDDNNVFAKMDPGDHRHARKVILTAILGTDMSRHMEHVTALHERADRRDTTPFERASLKDRISLVSNIVHCADLSAQTLPSVVSEVFEGRLMEEFSQQSSKEEEDGCAVSTFMKGLENKRKRCELQLNFVSAIALPLWRGMAKCFPKCSERVERGEEILKNYERILAEIDEIET